MPGILSVLNEEILIVKSKPSAGWFAKPSAGPSAVWEFSAGESGRHKCGKVSAPPHCLKITTEEKLVLPIFIVLS